MIPSCKYDFSMASKPKSPANSRHTTANGADDTNFHLSVTGDLDPLRTSQQLKASPSTSRDAAEDDTDDEDFAFNVTKGPRLLCRSKQLQDLVPPTGGINGYSNLTLPIAVPLTEHHSYHKSSTLHKQESIKLLELPLDVLRLVADHLDVVARACMKYAHPALGYCSEKDRGNLSACARLRIARFLQKDKVSIPKELLGVTENITIDRGCSEYHNFGPKYCVICRCNGHLSHCPKCRIRTCIREDAEFWQRWTCVMDDTVYLTDTTDSN